MSTTELPHTINDQLCAEMENTLRKSEVNSDSKDGEFHTLLKQVLKLAPKFQEHTESITVAEKTYETSQQIALDAGVALDRKTERFDEWFAKHVDKLVALRTHFPPAQSTRRLSIEVVTGTLEELTWGEFVEKYLHISLSWLNRLIKRTVPEDEESEKRSEAAKKANETKRRNAQERRAGEDNATDNVIAGGVHAGTLEDYNDAINPPLYDEKDAYWLFSQVKDEPATLANEIAGMLMEFGFDLGQITTVLNLAMKIAKTDLKKN